MGGLSGYTDEPSETGERSGSMIRPARTASMIERIDLPRANARTVLLAYSKRPAPLWRSVFGGFSQVSIIVRDPPYWLEVRPGADRVVRHGWPHHNPAADPETDPGWIQQASAVA